MKQAQLFPVLTQDGPVSQNSANAVAQCAGRLGAVHSLRECLLSTLSLVFLCLAAHAKWASTQAKKQPGTGSGKGEFRVGAHG